MFEVQKGKSVERFPDIDFVLKRVNLISLFTETIAKPLVLFTSLSQFIYSTLIVE